MDFYTLSQSYRKYESTLNRYYLPRNDIKLYRTD